MLRLIIANGRPLVPEAHKVERIRDLSEMPEKLARRVRAARGIVVGVGDVGSATTEGEACSGPTN